MKRVLIRDNRIQGKVKPRVFDYICNEKGQEKFEIKIKGFTRTIELSDAREQIREAQARYIS